MTMTISRKMLTGLLLGLLLLPVPVANVQAQLFGGIVHDPVNYGLQAEKALEEAQRWIDTVNHYSDMFNKAVEQITELKKVFGIVDRQLAKHMDTARLTFRISQIIHGARSLKDQVDYMVRYEIGVLQQIDDRLKNGIFNPAKDRADFEEYLWYTMGRNSRQTMQLLKRTIQADAQLSKWMTERDQMMTELYMAESAKRDLESRLRMEQGVIDDAYQMQVLTQALDTTIDRIITLKEQIRCLDELIEKRVNEYGLTVQEMENMGYPTRSIKLTWESSRQAQANIATAFDTTLGRTQP